MQKNWPIIEIMTIISRRKWVAAAMSPREDYDTVFVNVTVAILHVFFL